jgi:peptidoglycan/LPS O-acetylase OafA/YrhL
MAALAKFRSFLSDAPSLFRRHMSGGVYKPEIDGLRFFAIAIVVVGHVAERAVRFFTSARDLAEGSAVAATFLRPGLGVYLFFAISGFIIATQARKSRHSPLSAAFLKSYYWRRLLRIEPPYIVLLICTWAALVLTGFSPESTRHFYVEPQSLNLSLLGSVFYLHDLIWGTYPRLFGPGWTLEVEVQFYILAPLLFWLWFRLKDDIVRVIFGLAVLVVGVVVSLQMPPRFGPLSIDMSILRFFPYFWLGILLCDAQGWLATRVAALPGVAATALGWCGLAAYIVIPSLSDSDVVMRVVAFTALVAMFASAWAPRSGFRTFCATSWISLIGGACYSIYLVHMQTTQLVSMLAAKVAPNLGLPGVFALMIVQYAAIVAVGLLFYVAIERTFMLPDWHRQAGARLRALLTRSPRPTPAE